MPTNRIVRVGFLLGWAGIGLAASAQSQTLEPIGMIPGPAHTVHIHESRAYVSDGPTLRIVDVTDPATPTLLGSYTFPMRIYAVRVSGSVAYAAVDFYGLGILDVSNPAAPALLGAFETPGQAISLAISGTTAALADRISGVELIDVSNPRAPMSRGSSYVEGYAVDVDAAGSFAYVVDAPGGLSIVDLSASGDVTADGTQRTTENAGAVAVATHQSSAPPTTTLAAVVSTESLLELFDVSTPSAPRALGLYRDPGREPTRQLSSTASAGGLVRVRTQGSLAFFTDAYFPYPLRVVDLSDPAEPTLVAAYEAPGFIHDLAVSQDLVFLAVAAGPASAAVSSAPGVLILRLHS